MSMIGILFDIDELEGGLYGYAAYKVFFEALDTRQIAGCTLSDGDTNATLSGRANQYVIAVNAPSASTIANVRAILSKSNAKGLLPPSSRFMEDSQVRNEPLVQSTHIGSNGELINCTTGWVMEAWRKTREKAA